MRVRNIEVSASHEHHPKLDAALVYIAQIEAMSHQQLDLLEQLQQSIVWDQPSFSTQLDIHHLNQQLCWNYSTLFSVSFPPLYCVTSIVLFFEFGFDFLGQL